MELDVSYNMLLKNMTWAIIHFRVYFDKVVRCFALTTKLSDTIVFAFQASDYLGPEDLMRSEVEESQRKLQVVMDTLNFFKQVFQDRRENLHTYFKEDQEVKEWDFQSSLVFVRLDGFLRRLHMVQVSVFIHLRLPAPCWSTQIRDPKSEIGK